MADTVQNRLSQQETLIMYAEKIAPGYYGKTETREGFSTYNYTVTRQSETSLSDAARETRIKPISSSGSGKTPIDIILEREKAVGKISYTKEELQLFLGSFDSLLLSSLQPFVRFEKYNYDKKKSAYLNIEQSNIDSFKSFLSGSLSGRGSLSWGKRLTPGGWGIKKLDLEYITNQKTGYSSNVYKVDLEIFLSSCEDLFSNLSNNEFVYSLRDVLIGFPDEIKRMLEEKESGSGEISSAYKTMLEFGYSAGGDVQSKKAIENVLYGSLKERFSGEGKLESLLKNLRFRVFLTPYKWTLDLEENGTATFRINYFGYENLISTKNASNVMIYNSSLKEYLKKYIGISKLNKSVEKKGLSEEEKEELMKKKEAEEKNVENELKALRIAALQIFFRLMTYGDKNYEIKVNYDVFSQENLFKKTQNEQKFSWEEFQKKRLQIYGKQFSSNGFYLGYEKMPKSKATFMYNFEKILLKSKAEAVFTVGNKFKAGTEVRGTKEVYAGSGDVAVKAEVANEVAIYASKIPYFYLGDLLYYVSLLAMNNLKGDNEFPEGSSVEFVTDEIAFPAPWIGKDTLVNVNIGQIPISWDFFLMWFRGKVFNRSNLVYKLEEFLQEFFGYFITELFSGSSQVNTDVPTIGCHVLEYPINGMPEGPKKISYYLYEIKPNREPFVKFYIGNKRGIVKSVQFEREDDQYLSSHFMQRALEDEVEGNNLQFQRAIYNSTVTLFGNTVLQPGMPVEIVPTIQGVPLSNRANMDNIYDMGIGGIFQVVATKVSLVQNNFETVLTLRWDHKPIVSETVKNN